MLFYIPGTQGRLFRSEEDNYIRNISGKKLELKDAEGKCIIDKDLENLLWVEQKDDFLELTYPNNKILLKEEESLEDK